MSSPLSASAGTPGVSPRPSFDLERPITPSLHLNGSVAATELTASENYDDTDPIQRLQRELERTKADKDTLAAQYRNLLAKLTAMRTTLGNKLKQDAEELDRQEQLVQHLTVQNEDLTTTIETLKSELIVSNEEAERASKELEVMRTRALQESAQDVYMKERELHEVQSELEQCRMERDDWEQKALQEHVVADEARTALENLRREYEVEREAGERTFAELEAERQKSRNLQSVLEEFQEAKDHELRQAVKDYESQLMQTTQSLAEYKHRALTAELQLEETSTNTSRTQELEKEVKEKNLLIGKLRHEAVIMNEHLMEALRRLRRSSTDTTVDRRLVTNVLLSFLVTPRADPKRFEMLSLLSSILSWTDDEREKAGLQRKGSASQGSLLWGRSAATSPKGKSADLERTDETESFSKLWVEFLLTEAAAGEGASPPTKFPSLPNSPTLGAHLPHHLSPPGAIRGGKRAASFTSTAMASSPELVLEQPPRKGKEKMLNATDS
ncbi:hypothetical protein CERSUDRAFT_157152 [Gelatoporia subvermispora B]|uniref:GRIP domain-containing protein n=1 Tax=Ceriporiopsis subvermispora (strain B) TaxID=914234 RepID=M2QTN6_CERS8|nr:hypothetical protein CERSUDRAFT_157152 [Gelatoporia subvermispora B]